MGLKKNNEIKAFELLYIKDGQKSVSEFDKTESEIKCEKVIVIMYLCIKENIMICAQKYLNQKYLIKERRAD